MDDEEISEEIPEECYCCGYQTKKLTLFKNLDTKIGGGGKLIHDDFWYCDLCASTMASTSDRYLYEDANIMKTICYVGNVILDAIKKRK